MTVEKNPEKKSYSCAFCGKEFDHQPAASIPLPYFPAILDTCADGDGSCGIQWLAYACSERCAWLDALQRHKAWGMAEEEAREHLIGEHNLTPP